MSSRGSRTGPVAAALLLAALAAWSAPSREPDHQDEKALRAAAELGDARAEYELGRLIARAGDRAGQAAHWYRKAAEQGDADARQALSDLESSRGPGPRKGRAALERAKDCAKARKASDADCDALFVAAANEGSAEAQRAVGKARLDAITAAEFDEFVHDVPRTVESRKKPAVVEAVGWLRLSAVQGDPEAQFLLGGLLREGVYLEKDPESAARWYRRAADQGYEKAWEALDR